MNAISRNQAKVFSVFYYSFSSKKGNKCLQKGRMTWVLNEQELIGLRQSGPGWPILSAHHWHSSASILLRKSSGTLGTLR